MANNTPPTRFHPFFRMHGKKRDDRRENRREDRRGDHRDERKDERREREKEDRKGDHKEDEPRDKRRDEHREFLRETALDTKRLLPQVSSAYRTYNPQACTFYMLPIDSQGSTTTITSHFDLPPLDPSKCPGTWNLQPPTTQAPPSFRKTAIRVVNGDTLDTALSMNQGLTVTTLLQQQQQQQPQPQTPSQRSTAAKPTLILNLASDTHAGGGWANGAMAQEEELCYRSTLSLSLHRFHYPLHPRSALYTPNVALFRESFSSGHARLHLDPLHLPAFSVVSVAALRRPDLTADGADFADSIDRDMTKGKIRLVLRIAASEGHTRLVLGALGCGVFRNPSEGVAKCFLEVMREAEFRGGWWEEVVFAVMDNAPKGKGGKDGNGNFGIFYRALDGELV